MTDTSADKIYNVLFVDTGNSARSIMAEAILQRLGQSRFRAFSAGSTPKGEIDAETLSKLKHFNHSVEGLRSKSWDEFARPDAPEMDFIFTVCEKARDTTHPNFPGQPLFAHWPIPDPLEFHGTDPERQLFFADIYGRLHNWIDIFVNLPLRALDKLALKSRLDAIGRR